ncbi:hypothetical protein Taro_052315 [Colocasia esculenta]|uniref:PIFI-like Ig-like domain-containing protein n=1 Tax=Colocasia esculenta TaxID=4460 RepID=A0A843XJC2_COLES|nr:hypothetical protein [Colocasia esculenta]
MNGLPPMSGEKLTLFYNLEASKLVLNNDFGIAFHGGFNQPIMCSAEPRAMTKKTRGKADPPIYTIKICIPKHGLYFSHIFTEGEADTVDDHARFAYHVASLVPAFVLGGLVNVLSR